MVPGSAESDLGGVGVPSAVCRLSRAFPEATEPLSPGQRSAREHETGNPETVKPAFRELTFGESDR